MATNGLFEKRPAHELSLRRRFERLTADDAVKSDRMKKFVFLITIKLHQSIKKKDKETLLSTTVVLLVLTCSR
jgi:hypothetical protein